MSIKVCESEDFNQEYPERFDWNRVHQISISDIANEITQFIFMEYGEDIENRNNIMGLKKALRIISRYAEVYQKEIK